MTTPKRTPAPTKAISPQAAAGTDLDHLDTLLRELIAEHESLLAVTIEHRKALSEADLSGLSRCIQEQNRLVQRIAAIDIRRATVVRSIQAADGTPAGSADAPTVSAIAGAAPEPARSRLLGLGGRLRDLLNTLHREHQSLKLAAETLAAHVDGVMRQVCRHLSHTGTYARSGSVEAGAGVMTGLDVRT